MSCMDTGLDLWSEVKVALARVTNLSADARLGPETRFDELGLSSLDLLTFAFELEDKLEINLAELVPERSLATLGDALAMVTDLVGAAAAKEA